MRERVRGCWRQRARMCVLMRTQRRTANRMSRRARACHSQTAAVVVVGNKKTGAVGMRAVGTGGKVAPQCARTDAGAAVADGDRGGVGAPPSVTTYAAVNDASQAVIVNAARRLFLQQAERPVSWHQRMAPWRSALAARSNPKTKSPSDAAKR